MKLTPMQLAHINDLQKALDNTTQSLKDSGMDDQMIAYYLNHHASNTEVYALDIERQCMHLNRGYSTWTANN